MLRIQRVFKGNCVMFVLSGRIRAEDIAELHKAFEAESGRRVLDLREVALVDREAVRFLARCEAGGIELTNCPAYVREWIGAEGTER
jgi:hypothetical protein